MVFKKLPFHVRIALISSLARLLYVVITVLSVRIITGLIDINGYAIFAILMNVVTWMLLADFGIGSSLQNFISECKVKKQDYHNYILIAVSILFILLILYSIILYLTYPFFVRYLFNKINFKKGFNVNFVFLCSSIMGILTGLGTVSYKIFNAFQLTYLQSVLTFFGSILSIIGIKLLEYFHSVSMESIVFTFFGGTMIASFVPLIYFFITALRNCNISELKYEYKIIVKRIIASSLRFWIFNLSAAFVLQIDYIVMSQTLAASNIALYNILFRLYSIVFMVYTMLLNALWPSFTEWNHNNMRNKIFESIRLYVPVGIIATIFFSIGLYFFTPIVINFISKLKFEVPNELIFLFGIYFIIRVWTDTFSTVLLSSNHFKPLWIFTPLQAILAICLEYTLAKYYGVNGIISGLILSFVLTVVWGFPYSIYKKIK